MSAEGNFPCCGTGNSSDCGRIGTVNEVGPESVGSALDPALTPGLAEAVMDDTEPRPQLTDVGALLAKQAAYISRTVTASYPDRMDPELVMRRRVGKIFVEAGELGDAIEGWTGENPRKGVYATREDVIKELIDCASASLCAIEYMTGDAGLSVGMVARQVIGNAQRLSASMPDRSGPDGAVAAPIETPVQRQWYGRAGHCCDIDGNLWHQPGDCAACASDCCGYAVVPAAASAVLSGDAS